MTLEDDTGDASVDCGLCICVFDGEGLPTGRLAMACCVPAPRERTESEEEDWGGRLRRFVALLLSALGIWREASSAEPSVFWSFRDFVLRRPLGLGLSPSSGDTFRMVTSGDCTRCEDLEAFRLAKNDFEGSLECFEFGSEDVGKGGSEVKTGEVGEVSEVGCPVWGEIAFPTSLPGVRFSS